MKLSTVFDGYWLSKRLDMSQHTVIDYSLTFRRLLAYLGGVDFACITTTDLPRFLDHTAGAYELSKRTLSNIWIALSSLWTWAEIELDVPHIIRDHIKRPDFPTSCLNR